MRRIADLIYSQKWVSGSLLVEQALKLLEAEPGLDSLATIELDGSFGLVSRSRLTQEVGRRFGYALYARKPIHIFNEEQFLTCDAEAEPVSVITEATKRPEHRIYDDIVVTRAGRYLGLVSMRLLMAHGKDLLVRSMAEVGELEEQNRRLDELNRAQREFVANITHELRAPLNTMLGVANLLSLDTSLTPERQRDVSMLLNRGRDLLALINNLLELHRLNSGEVVAHPTMLDLRDLLDDCVEAVQYQLLGRPVELRRDYASLAEPVELDGVLFKRILTNLLSNAAKFTELGTVTLSARHDAGKIELSVADTGIGIAPEDLPKLFRRFTQLEESRTKRHAGTGLGLAIVKDLVTLMGGSVEVESQVDEGTTFRITLPSSPSQ